MYEIIVGIDGSEGSARALRWALTLVPPGDVQAVHAVAREYAPTPSAGRAALALPEPDTLIEDGYKQLRRWVEEIAPEAVEEIGLEVRIGPTVRELLAAADGADLVVVGSRGLGGFAGLLLGSVSRQIAAHASCPAVIVPERGQMPVAGGEIVVGLDGSDGSRDALAWATGPTGQTAGTVTAVNVVDVGLRSPAFDVIDRWEPFEDRQELEEQGIEMLRGIVREVVGDAADDVEVEVAIGTPALRLIERAEDANLLVVGRRGLGGFRRLLLGSVSHQCVTHAPCPVVVVPAATETNGSDRT